MRTPVLLAVVVTSLLCTGFGAAGPAPVTLAVPRTATAGLPLTAVVRVEAAGGPVRVVGTSGSLRRVFPARRGGVGTYRATIALPEAGRWSLAATAGSRRSPARIVTARTATAGHPYAVAVAPDGTAYVSDGPTGRVLRLGRRGLVVHARGFSEPTGLAAAAGAVYVADFTVGAVRRVDARGAVKTIATLPQVASVAVGGDGTAYAVAIDGPLVRIAPNGAVTRLAQLDRPHGVTLDTDGTLLVAEDSKRVRRVTAGGAPAGVVAASAGANRVAVAPGGVLYIAGTSPTSGSLRRLDRDGTLTTLVSDLRVSDVGVLPGGDLLVTAIEPGLVLRVDPRTGARTKLAG